MGAVAQRSGGAEERRGLLLLCTSAPRHLRLVLMSVRDHFPASTSNLGASFDACGVALSLYLKVTVEEQHAGFQIALWAKALMAPTR